MVQRAASKSVSDKFAAFSDPTRLRILHLLREGELCVGDLVTILGMPQPTVHCWVRRGWIRGRKLPGTGGRWVLWADAEELERLRRLRAYRRTWADEPSHGSSSKHGHAVRRL